MITAKTKDLLKAVEFAAQVCGQRSTLAAFSHVLMVAAEKSISVYASNIAISITTSCDAEVKKPEMFGVPARQLVDWLKSLSGETIEMKVLDCGKVGATCGTAKALFATLPTDEFGKWPEDKLDMEIVMPSRVLFRMIDKVKYAIGDEKRGPAYNAIAIESSPEGLSFIATPGNMIAVSKGIGIKMETKTFIIPSDLSQIIGRSVSPDSDENVEIKLSDKRISVSSAQWAITGSLVDDRYPRWRDAIPKSYKHALKLPRKEVLDAIRRVRLFSTESFFPVSLEFSKKGLRVQNVGGVHAGEDIVEMKAPEVKITANPTWLIDTLDTMEGEEVEFKCTDSRTPIMFSEEGFLALIAVCAEQVSK